MSLADNLRRARLTRFWSQTELAEKANVSRATIARVELGGYVPQLKTIRRLAEALSVEPGELVTIEELEGETAAGTSPPRPVAASGSLPPGRSTPGKEAR
jgi:transcriptional regulator with XRE-family HTH domain